MDKTKPRKWPSITLNEVNEVGFHCLKSIYIYV